jgi:hypothetical protein
LADCVCQFGPIERCDPNGGKQSHSAEGFRGMSVLYAT